MNVPGLLAQAGPWLPEGVPAWWPDFFAFSSTDWLALLAFGVLWLNMLLIAGSAILEARRLRARLLRFAPGSTARPGLLRVRVISGRGDGGAFASHRVEQLGRSRGDGHVFFHDRLAHGEIHGGLVELETRDGPVTIEVELRGSEHAEVWPSRAKLRQATACPDADTFEQAHVAAQKARGWTRTVHTVLREGDELWVHGHLEPARGEEPPRLVMPDDAPLFVSAVDPVRWTFFKVALAVGFAVATVAVTLACSVAALWPPVFGTVSTLGAFAAVVALLGNMPLGTAVRDAVLPPSRAFVRGSWRRG